jgi:glycosyltransferase involved in cell wall biosynthesis
LKLKKKILLVSLANSGGGASKIVHELFNNLTKTLMFDVELLIQEGGYFENNTFLINNSLYEKFVFRLKNKIAKFLSILLNKNQINYESFNIFPSNLLNKINNSDADIVHLHWIGAEMISILQLSKINKKIIWTMHDAWPLNGSCHINPREYDPEYVNINSQFEKPISLLDLYTLNRKVKYLSNKEFVFTAPSHWLKEKYDVSFYNKNTTKCILIPNFIDFTKWVNIDKKYARSLLNINSNKKILIYGAGNLNKSYNKGFHFLKDISNSLDSHKFAFIIFGNSENNIMINPLFEVYHFNQIKDHKTLIAIYSAGDITIVPSYSESFSMISLESIACNTPVVAFNTSGIKDIISHKFNGYLAKKFDSTDIINGINWVLNNPKMDISKSIKMFSTENIINQYCNIYNTIK